MDQLTHRFQQLEDGQRRHQEKLEDQEKTLARIEQNTAGLSGLHVRVRSLEKWRNRIGGALALLLAMIAALLKALPAVERWWKG